MIELLRDYKSDRTIGGMALEDGTSLRTIERPWINNTPKVSCIPEGVYKLAQRPSAVVTRTTHGKYLEGWEVAGVENRSEIMIHIANFPFELLGCIGVGLTIEMMPSQNGFELAAKKSAAAFDVLMKALASRDEWYLEIKSMRKPYEIG